MCRRGSKYQEEIDDEDQGAALEQMKKDGVTVTEITDIDKWKEAVLPCSMNTGLKVRMGCIHRQADIN